MDKHATRDGNTGSNPVCSINPRGLKHYAELHEHNLRYLDRVPEETHRLPREHPASENSAKRVSHYGDARTTHAAERYRLLRGLVSMAVVKKSLLPAMNNMVTMEQQKPSEQEMMYVPQDVRETLKAWAAAERARQGNPLVADMITWKSLGVKALRELCKRSGYYTGKTTIGE